MTSYGEKKRRFCSAHVQSSFMVAKENYIEPLHLGNLLKFFPSLPH